MEEDDKYPQQGGGRTAGVRIFLQICRSVGAAIWRGDMGDYPCMGQFLGGFQYQVARLLTGRLPRRRSDGK